MALGDFGMIGGMIASDVQQLRRNPLSVPITVDQYHQMIAAGILEEGQPIELLDGFLVRKDRSRSGDNPMTVGHEHVWVVYQLGELNERLKPHGCFIRTQQPVTLPPDNEPEPDGAILQGAPDAYRHRLAGPADILAVIEVADSSLHDDRTAKQRIYAAAEISRYIIINLVDRVIEVYSVPHAAQGRYASMDALRPGQVLRLPTGDETIVDVAVEKLLP
ncbi:MAG: Uma2 family endonuclease [Tepidisphaeraceae bacterium]|jgi:Uma2 family endonuclease